MVFRNVCDMLLGFLFPDRCAGCGRAGALFCGDCLKRVRPYPGELHALPETLSDVQIAYVFEGPLRAAVHRLKYRGTRRMARPLAHAIAGRLAHRPCAADAVTAIPLHGRRQAERGYNQAEEIARELARLWGLPYLNGLVRVRNTAQQARLPASARAANVLNAFEWRGGVSLPRHIILVDDVITTGATMGACAETLLLAGVDRVDGIALARSKPELDRRFAARAPRADYS